MTYAAEVRARAERGRIAGLYGTAGALGGIIGRRWAEPWRSIWASVP